MGLPDRGTLRRHRLCLTTTIYDCDEGAPKSFFVFRWRIVGNAHLVVMANGLTAFAKDYVDATLGQLIRVKYADRYVQ